MNTKLCLLLGALTVFGLTAGGCSQESQDSVETPYTAKPLRVETVPVPTPEPTPTSPEPQPRSASQQPTPEPTPTPTQMPVIAKPPPVGREVAAGELLWEYEAQQIWTALIRDGVVLLGIAPFVPAVVHLGSCTRWTQPREASYGAWRSVSAPIGRRGIFA